MAIYIDGKMLVAKKNGNSLEKRFFEEKEEVETMFSKFKIDGKERATIICTRDYERIYNRARTSWKPAAPISLPLVAHIYDNELGSIEIRYSRTPPRKTGPGVLQWDADKETSMFFETWAINSDQLDYAWFMLKATNYLKNGLFRIVDNKADFDNKFEVVVLQKDIMNILFNKSATVEFLAKVAAKFMDKTEIHYPSITGKEELAIKIYQKADINHASKKKPSFKELLELCDKIGLPKTPISENTKFVVVEAADGGSTEIPITECPKTVDWNDLVDEAKVLGITTAGKKKDVVYTLVQHKKVPA